MNFEIIPSEPKDTLIWYETKLKEVKIINDNCIKNGYEPLGSMISLMLNYNKNIRHLKHRINELNKHCIECINENDLGLSKKCICSQVLHDERKNWILRT